MSASFQRKVRAINIIVFLDSGIALGLGLDLERPLRGASKGGRLGGGVRTIHDNGTA